MTSRKPISAEEFRRKRERRHETAEMLSNPMLGAAKGAMKFFSATAETVPTVGGAPFDMQTEGVIPRSFDVGPATVGLGAGWQPQIDIGDTTIPLSPFAPGAEALADNVPGVRDFGRPDPRAVSAFSEFVSPTEGPERRGFG